MPSADGQRQLLAPNCCPFAAAEVGVSEHSAALRLQALLKMTGGKTVLERPAT